MKRNPNYIHKTTKAEFVQFKTQSKHGGELLHKIYMNETQRGVPYQEFLSNLTKWLRLEHNVDTRDGVAKINEYLRNLFV